MPKGERSEISNVPAARANTTNNVVRTKYSELKPLTIKNPGNIKYGKYTYTKAAGKHFNEFVKSGKHAGQLSRPYMSSEGTYSTIEKIMSASKGVPDATFKGGMNWVVPGIFRGSKGVWQLGINPETNVIYHFNFVH